MPASTPTIDDARATLLLVDDEEHVLASLRRLLRRDGYHIVTACSAAEGLAQLTQRKVDVIVSDQRMPGVTGVEFLRQAKALHPHTIRMVLSGYTELQSILDAINEGAIYKFLTKPWDDDRLRDHIAEAVHQKAMADENRRLSRELEAANAELAVLNDRLAVLLSRERGEAELFQRAAAGPRDALEALPVPVIIIDGDGVLALGNAQARRLLPALAFGLGAPAAQGLPPEWLAMLDPAGHTDGWCELAGQRHRVLCSAWQCTGEAAGHILLLLPAAPDGEH